MRNTKLVFQCLMGATLLAGCPDDQQDLQVYEQTNLLSDLTSVAPNVDLDLVNPWGIAYGPNTPFWIANTGSATSSIVDGRGDLVGPRKIETQAAPTGIVHNPTLGFHIRSGAARGPSTFLYATAQGLILGWSHHVDPERTVVAVDESASGSSYTGLAMARMGYRSLLYAADFGEGEIDVFDAGFMPAEGLVDDPFFDPTMPSGYAPFGISTIDDLVYVTYARQDATGEEAVPGPGAGYIDVYEPNGRLVQRLHSRGELNAPWAVVQAPSYFGVFSDALLVGNFGDGRIMALDPDDGTMLGVLEDRRGEPIVIEGLWGMVFGNDRMAGRSDALYFTAGIDDERHGLYGRVTVVR